jgi:hypothetical protein
MRCPVAPCCVLVFVAIVVLPATACGPEGDDVDGDSADYSALPTSVTTSGAGATAILDGELFVASRTLPALALSAEQLESVGEAESAGGTITLAKGRTVGLESWERVSAAPDGWRVWQPALVLQVADGAGAGATIAKAEPTLFGDACLGVAAPGEVCAAAITPGYRVIIERNGAQTEYRIDLQGNIRRVD